MDRELVEFIQDSFGSVWSLEILLALHREPGRDWQPEQIIDELRSSQAVVRKGLEELLAAGLILVEDSGSVRYGPSSPRQDEIIRQLAETYRVKPGPVRRLIVQGPSEKLRTFSDAFRIIKD
ncbi:hypothetical protein Rumeso_02467 [Rubellimicrobium mesophilum DSM 19309]|uniref:Uncharacterized protein n=1 Tax=Rubellimicrobium mesophilum DSM 19309 TaxID=442562 RepID=A0A017HPJ4_9RHOB|nr:helix-turn-helix transcriptional regulator [Rubellimicrobium mesophilum]EYD76038.1 hypothetical protein Rumeso_02467 [Rubellimicrobium mesophilum DSM 19309]